MVVALKFYVDSHSFLYFIVRAGNGVFAIATVAVFSRLLSPEEYGFYSVGIAVATVASAILFQWLSLAVGRFYPMYYGDTDKVMAAAARAFWCASAVATLICVGVLTFYEVLGVGPMLVVILFLITVALGRHALALQEANARGALLLYGLISWAKGGGSLLAGFIFVNYSLSGQGALLGCLAGLLFAVISFAPKPWMTMKLGNGDTRLSAQMFRYGLPLTLNTLAIMIVDVADRFMIGKLLGVAYVAPYAVAYDIVQQLVGPVMHVLFLAAFPLIVKVFEGEGGEPARIHLLALGNRLVGFGLPVAVGVGVLASDIAEIILGSLYRQDATMIMPWLAAAIFLAAFKGYFLDVVFQLRQQTKYQAYIAIFMAMVNIVLNLLLLPHYGVIAAAWATLAAFTAGTLASWVVGKSVFLLPALGNVFWKSAFASVMMALALYLLPYLFGIVWLSIKVILGVITYATMAWVLDIAGCRKFFKA